MQYDSTVYLYQERLDKYIEDINNQIVEQIYENVTQSIKRAANEALGIRTRPKSNKYWWNREIEELVKEKKILYHKWLNTKKEEGHKIYKEAKRRTRRKISERKGVTWEMSRNRDVQSVK